MSAQRAALLRQTVTLPAPDAFDKWRAVARELLACAIDPDRVEWRVAGEGSADLFGGEEFSSPTRAGKEMSVPRAFLQHAKNAALHNNPLRFDLLYRLLWRLQFQQRLMDDGADSDVRLLHDLARQVRRDIHKMRAFVRFREACDADGQAHYIAWFEPQFHILRASSKFFVDRFANMRWSILTPLGSLRWDGESLHHGPPAVREDAPAEDATEDLWQRYYASIFNPARLKVKAMLKEMPRRYWKNMPEAALIPQLIAGAQAREAAMVESGADLFAEEELPQTLEEIATAIQGCRRCSIGCNGSRAVSGEGIGKPRVMIVGEQPGDIEEREGRPFVGPAGQLLDQHLQRAGIDRRRVWMTNAVKHFKFRQQGKRRLHETPTAREIDMCRWWLDREKELIQPQLVLALGASAARGFLGKTVSVQRERGRALSLTDGTELWVTVHPSFLLRIQDDDLRAVEAEKFDADLRAVRARMAELLT